MFEKSLYDLIRGLRHHKGNERAYIQDSIRECRREIKSQDMDLKATALMKLTYLEMFGHDMSWASFNVLEVMSSPKYPQKRVGYLSAVQSFRADTEVLMLAENLLKKDLTSPHPPTISLPLLTIPHVITPQMANSLLTDLLMRLTHSLPSIRKKTIATLYRLALVYPETLRPTWPKLKERLLDENEDSSVTAATVNVVCELGWRRPQDFLPLAPRLFDLLVGGSNNWMAIKIIKLFATLTPLEPRLVKKLLPPLTTIIKTTPSMSLLYECINGIIQGGILQGSSGSHEGDEIARLCVGKLRGMLVIEGDPNLKYVALLAFNKIVELHPYLVSLHEDVILECIDDGDISIRLCALDLVVGMVNADNLASIVGRLMRQLRNSPLGSLADDPYNDRVDTEVASIPDMDDEEAEKTIHKDSQSSAKPQPLTDDYREGIITRIISMCSRNTYANINDFDWYIETLVQLVRHVPSMSPTTSTWSNNGHDSSTQEQADVASKIGAELRNIAVRVVSSRREAVQAAGSLISIDRSPSLFPPSDAARGVLGPTVFIVGEFASLLPDPSATLTSLIHPDSRRLPAHILTSYIQAALKVFAFITGDEQQIWSSERKTMMSLLLARVIHFLEPLTTHPDLQVQELAVSYLELVRLANEAVSTQRTDTDDGSYAEPPLLLTQAIPSLFSGMELRPVAPDAQRKVPIPDDLDLDTPINPNLHALLNVDDLDNLSSTFDARDDDPEFYDYYYVRPSAKSSTPAPPEPAADRLALSSEDAHSISYQSAPSDIDPSIQEQRRLDRLERNRDDPFYIPSSTPHTSNSDAQANTQIHNIISSSNPTPAHQNGTIDSIPILELNLNDEDLAAASASAPPPRRPARPLTSQNASYESKQRRPVPRTAQILADEDGPSSSSSTTSPRPRSPLQAPAKKSLLHLDSSTLGSISLADDASGTANGRKPSKLDHDRRVAEEEEMGRAMREIERLRLEMQREKEGIVEGVDMGAVRQKPRKKVKKKKVEIVDEEAEGVGKSGEVAEGEASVRRKKKKKERMNEAGMMEGPADADARVGAGDGGEADESVVRRKRKKKRNVTFAGDETAGVVADADAEAAASSTT